VLWVLFPRLYLCCFYFIPHLAVFDVDFPKYWVSSCNSLAHLSLVIDTLVPLGSLAFQSSPLLGLATSLVPLSDLLSPKDSWFWQHPFTPLWGLLKRLLTDTTTWLTVRRYIRLQWVCIILYYLCLCMLMYVIMQCCLHISRIQIRKMNGSKLQSTSFMRVWALICTLGDVMGKQQGMWGC